MRHVRYGTFSLPALLLFWFPGLGLAQTDEHPQGFYLTTPMTLSGGYDSGFQVGSQQFSDDVTLLESPTFAWLQTTHRTDFSIDYQAEGELFAQHPGLDAWNHTSTMRLLHRINSRWSTDTGNSFLSTMDSSRALQNSLLLLPWGRFSQNAFYSSLIERLNQTTKITYRFDNAWTNFALPGMYAERLDQLSFAGSVSIDHDLTSRQKLTGTYAYLHVDPLHAAVAGSPTNVILLNAGYSIAATPGLLFRVAAGGIEGTESAVTGSGEVEKSIGGAWFAAGYQRYLGFFQAFEPVEFLPPNAVPFGNGLAPTSVYQVISLRSWGQLSKRWSLELNAQHALNGVNVAGQQIKSIMGQAQLNYKVNDRFSLFARADYYGENSSPFFADPLSRRRYFGGLQIALARPPERENLGNKHGKAPQNSDDPTAGEPANPQDN